MFRPLTFFPLFFPLFFSLIFIKSNGNATYAYCFSTKCGDQEVKYPFWVKNNPNPDLDISTAPVQHCGYEGFGLDCRQSSTSSDGRESHDLFLQPPNDDFYVKAISYTDHTVTLVDHEVIKNPGCPRARQNLTLEDLPLNYNKLDLNLGFYFNCTRPLHFSNTTAPILSADCLRSGEKTSYVFLETNQQDEEPNNSDWLGVCEQKVVAAVIYNKQEGGNNDWGRLFVGAMNDGFVLDWGPPESDHQCSSCEHSEGYCGFNNDTQKFLCFCNDGTTNPDRCNKLAKGHGLNVRLKIGIGVAAAAGTALIMCLIFFVYNRRQKKNHSGSTLLSRDISSYPSSVDDPEKGNSNYGVHIFDYSELEEATNNFDSEKELGDGGFGTVYKGKLKDGRDVAVKRLYESNFKRVEHFRNEVDILTRLRHQNLVTLYGCTSRHCRELLLVYEYVPNGTVADHLHGALARPVTLPWSTRMKIAIETASALSYLHASDVIHRDVKTNNILLDNNFCVKVADFGLSRLFPINATHISTAPQGTPGYVDPEYHQCYHLTDRSDVFSFGVVLIELISSMPAVDITRHRHEINLSNMAINKIQSQSLHELVDPNLGFESDYNVRMMITDVAELAFQSLQNGREMRPSMQHVLEGLIQIQSKDYSGGNAKEMDIQADDVTLLKARQLTSSPDSVIEGWVSRTTTPSTSN